MTAMVNESTGYIERGAIVYDWSEARLLMSTTQRGFWNSCGHLDTRYYGRSPDDDNTWVCVSKSNCTPIATDYVDMYDLLGGENDGWL